MIEKILVEGFDVLENNGQMGIRFQLNDMPAVKAEFIYDGGSCAILLRNEVKAYIMTNIAPEVRKKLYSVGELIVIETDGKEIVHSYGTVVTKVKKIEPEDIVPDALRVMLEDIHKVYGPEGVRLIAERFWDIR